MRKKQFLIIITFLLCFIPFVDVKAVTSTNYETGSNGDGLDVSGSSASCSTSQGCEHTSNYGVRVTLVDVDGKIIKGTHFVDFWNNIPTNARAKNGSTYRSAYVNSSNYAGASSESFGAVGSYAKGNVTNDLTLIGGSINNESQHTLIEGVIRDELEKYKNSGDCSELKFFDYFGYTDFCSMLTANDCEKALSNVYVLIEPLFYVNYKTKNVAVTGTELAAMIYKTRIDKGDRNSTYNLNKATFDSAIVRMYLTNDDPQYKFNANGKVYEQFNSYVSGFNNVNVSAYSDANFLKTVVTMRNADHYPLGNSMHLVWLGTFSEDYCDSSGCCVPCDPNDSVCITNAGNNYHANDPYCCEVTDSSSIISTTGVCEDGTPADDYWNNNQELYNKVCPIDCCIPDSSNGYCCTVTGSTLIAPDGSCFNGIPADEYWNTPAGQSTFAQYCTSCCVPSESNDYCCEETNSIMDESGACLSADSYWTLHDKNVVCREVICGPIDLTLTPICKTADCDDQTSNVSVFEDPAISTINDIKIDKTTGMVDYSALQSRFSDPAVVKDLVSYRDNSFLAIALEGEEYKEEINEYCDMYCQQIAVVTLPDSYPVANSGRYFQWNILTNTDANALISQEIIKVCAEDIKLDKVIERYYELIRQQQERINTYANVMYTCSGGQMNGVTNFFNISEAINGGLDSLSSYHQAQYACCKGQIQKGFTCETRTTCPCQGEGAGECCAAWAAQASQTCQQQYDAWKQKGDACNKLLEVGSEERKAAEDFKKATTDGIYLDAMESVLDEFSECFSTELGDEIETDLKFELYNDLFGSYTDEDFYSYSDGISKTYSSTPLCIDSSDCDIGLFSYDLNIDGISKISSTAADILISSAQAKAEAARESLKKLSENNDPYPLITKVEFLTADDVNKAIQNVDMTCSGDTWYSTDLRVVGLMSLLDEEANFEKKYADWNNKCASIAVDNTQPYGGVGGSEQRNCYDQMLSSNLSDYSSLINKTSQIEKYSVPNWVELSNYSQNFPLYINDYIQGQGWSVPNTAPAGKYLTANDYMASKNINNWWSTVRILLQSKKDSYVIDDNINACVCSDGTVMDLVEDYSNPGKYYCPCDPEESSSEYSYEDSGENFEMYQGETSGYCKYSGYIKITEGGNYSLAYMTNTGQYPLKITYSNIGSIDESGVAHFESMLGSCVDENGMLGATNCTESGCVYEGAYCTLQVLNTVMSDDWSLEYNDDWSLEASYKLFTRDKVVCIDDCRPSDDDVPPCPDCHDDDDDDDDDDVCPDADCPTPRPKPECPDGDCPVGGLDIVYRIVNLADPFPNRNAGKNWQGSELRISENRGVSGNELYSANVEPLYSFTLTPNIIKNIRNYNNSVGHDYANSSSIAYPGSTVGTSGEMAVIDGSGNIEYKVGVSQILRSDLAKIFSNEAKLAGVALDDLYEVVGVNTPVNCSDYDQGYTGDNGVQGYCEKITETYQIVRTGDEACWSMGG